MGVGRSRLLDVFLSRIGVRFEYSLHQPLRSRNTVRQFATELRAFPDLGFAATADLIAAGEHIVVEMPEASGKKVHFAGSD